MLRRAIENQRPSAEDGAIALGPRLHDGGDLVLDVHAIRDRVRVLYDSQTLVPMDKLHLSEERCSHLLVRQTERIAQLSDLHRLEDTAVANLRETTAKGPPAPASARSRTAASASGRSA